jgi:hypothetical protein
LPSEPQPAIIDIADLSLLGGSGNHVKIADYRGTVALHIVGNGAAETTKSWKPDRDYKIVSIFNNASQFVISRAPVTIAAINSVEGIFFEKGIFSSGSGFFGSLLEYPLWRGEFIYITLPAGQKLTLLLRSVPDFLLRTD